MPMTDAIRCLVLKHANAAVRRCEAIRVGMVPMYEDGMRKAVKGVTTFEEVLRATRED
jgi:general secretion pathway protein E